MNGWKQFFLFRRYWKNLNSFPEVVKYVAIEGQLHNILSYFRLSVFPVAGAELQRASQLPLIQFPSSS
jgi:hypothetical protein